MKMPSIKLLMLLALFAIVASAEAFRAFYAENKKTNALFEEQNQLLGKEGADRAVAKSAEHKFFNPPDVKVIGRPFKPEW